jgi:glutamine amidotransferase
MPKIAVLNYGIGNLRNVQRSFQKLGAITELVPKPFPQLDQFDGLVLSGVGAFQPAMKNLLQNQSLLQEQFTEGKPILGICLGLQLLFDKSFEDGECSGLAFLKGTVDKIDTEKKLPKIGWNTIEIVQSNALLEGIPTESFFYFVHSYAAFPERTEIILAKTNYGSYFPSVIADKNLYATQFHPEKSSRWGLKLLENFISICKR